MCVEGKHPFQFHKGTIKTEDWMMQNRSKSNFNSIKVRLKQAYRGNKPLLDAQFQFHKGTIKTR